jgi:hypothetical protein
MNHRYYLQTPRPLHTYGIQNEDTIHITGALLGGGPRNPKRHKNQTPDTAHQLATPPMRRPSTFPPSPTVLSTVLSTITYTSEPSPPSPLPPPAADTLHNDVEGDTASTSAQAKTWTPQPWTTQEQTWTTLQLRSYREHIHRDPRTTNHHPPRTHSSRGTASTPFSNK